MASARLVQRACAIGLAAVVGAGVLVARDDDRRASVSLRTAGDGSSSEKHDDKQSRVEDPEVDDRDDDAKASGRPRNPGSPKPNAGKPRNSSKPKNSKDSNKSDKPSTSTKPSKGDKPGDKPGGGSEPTTAPGKKTTTTQPTPPTNPPPADADGTEIQRTEGLWVLDLETGTPRFHVWTQQSHARFSPTEPVIVTKATESSIDLFPLDGSAPQQIVSCAQTGCSEPEWSPDGTKLRYYDYWRRVFVVNRDGSPVSSFSTPDQEHQAIDGFAFAPDGEHVAWSTSTWDRLDDLGGGYYEPHIAATDLRIARIDGSQERVVRHDTGRYLWPEWSHDGKYLAWNDEQDQMFVMTVATGAVREVQIPSGPVYSFAWAPTGLFVGGTSAWRFNDATGAGTPSQLDSRGSQVVAANTGAVAWQRRPADGFATPGDPVAGPVSVGHRDAAGAISTVAWIGDSWSLEVVDMSSQGRYVAFYAIEPWWR